MKAIWKGTVVAESDDTVVVEGNHYFPASAVKAEYLLPSNTKTMCSWKGQASYHYFSVAGSFYLILQSSAIQFRVAARGLARRSGAAASRR